MATGEIGRESVSTSERHLIAIVDDEGLLSSRYPEAVGTGSARVAVRAGRSEDLSKPEAAGGIVDGVGVDEVLSALRSDKPVLLSMKSLATLVREANEPAATLLDRDWVPFLPVGLSAEVRSAAEILKGGDMGTIRSCHLTTHVGPITAKEWEQDAPFARSFFEATVFGLDLLANLFGAPVNSTRWLRNGAAMGFGVAVHELGGRSVAVQQIVPSQLMASPLFTATVNCEGGRVLLRDEFAPGGLAVWEAPSRSFRCPALPREKANVQSPDTARGGLETTTLVMAFVDGERGGLPTREHALLIVEHAIASGAADAPRTEGEPKEIREEGTDSGP